MCAQFQTQEPDPVEYLSSSPGVKLKKKFYFPCIDKKGHKDDTHKLTIRVSPALRQTLQLLFLITATLLATADPFERPQRLTCTAHVKASAPICTCTAGNKGLGCLLITQVKIVCILTSQCRIPSSQSSIPRTDLGALFLLEPGFEGKKKSRQKEKRGFEDGAGEIPENMGMLRRRQNQ